MKHVTDLLMAGNWPAAAATHGLTPSQMKEIVDRVERDFPKVRVKMKPSDQENVPDSSPYAAFELVGGEKTLTVNMGVERNRYTQVLMPTLSMYTRDYNSELCAYPPDDCSCTDDEECSSCDLGSDYCTTHETYH